MDTLKFARLAVEHSTGIGAGIATISVIRSNMRISANPLIKGCQYMGMFGLSGVAGEAASKYSLNLFDDLVASIKGSPTTSKKN